MTKATERVSALEALRVNVIFGRARVRMSQDQLARRASVSRPTISRIERGAGDVGIDVVQRIADALGTSVAELFTPAFDGPVTEAELARRAAAPASEFVDVDDLVAAMDEAAASGEHAAGRRRSSDDLPRYSRAGRRTLAR
jgi:transcriptional regulator with XRE-family HTH domain